MLVLVHFISNFTKTFLSCCNICHSYHKKKELFYLYSQNFHEKSIKPLEISTKLILYSDQCGCFVYMNFNNDKYEIMRISDAVSQTANFNCISNKFKNWNRHLSIFVQYLVYKHIKCFSKMKLRWDLDILQVQF